MSAEFFRKYIDIISEAGLNIPGNNLVDPDTGGINPNSNSSVVKAATQSATSTGMSDGGLALPPTKSGSGDGGMPITPNKMNIGPTTPISEKDDEERVTPDRFTAKSGSLVDFTDTDKYDNFVPPDEEDNLDYKSGRMDPNAPVLPSRLGSPKRSKFATDFWLSTHPEFKKKD